MKTLLLIPFAFMCAIGIVFALYTAWYLILLSAEFGNDCSREKAKEYFQNHKPSKDWIKFNIVAVTLFIIYIAL